MSEIRETKRVRTRKRHFCTYCNAMIPPGTKALCEHGVSDGYPFSNYVCGMCEPHVDAFWDWCWPDLCTSIPTWFEEFMADQRPDDWKRICEARDRSWEGGESQ